MGKTVFLAYQASARGGAQIDFGRGSGAHRG